MLELVLNVPVRIFACLTTTGGLGLLALWCRYTAFNLEGNAIGTRNPEASSVASNLIGFK